MYQRWERYRRECQETLETAGPPAGVTAQGLGRVDQTGGAWDSRVGPERGDVCGRRGRAGAERPGWTWPPWEGLRPECGRGASRISGRGLR